MDPLSRLVERYSATYVRLQADTAQMVGNLWRSIGSMDPNGEFAPEAAAFVAAAQEAQGALTASFYEAVNEGATGQPTPVEIDPAALVGLRGVDPVEVYARPSKVARIARSRGYSTAEAMAQAGERARNLARTDLALTQREASFIAISQLPQIVGYIRVPTGISCAICVSAAGTYGRHVHMPVHPNCDCVSSPVYRNVSPGAAVVADVTAGRDDQVSVEVVEHPELGPLLVDSDPDDF